MEELLLLCFSHTRKPLLLNVYTCIAMSFLPGTAVLFCTWVKPKMILWGWGPHWIPYSRIPPSKLAKYLQFSKGLSERKQEGRVQGGRLCSNFGHLTSQSLGLTCKAKGWPCATLGIGLCFSWYIAPYYASMSDAYLIIIFWIKTSFSSGRQEKRGRSRHRERQRKGEKLIDSPTCGSDWPGSSHVNFFLPLY